MLRRDPTLIRLRPDDISDMLKQVEQRRAAKAAAAAPQSSSSQGKLGPPVPLSPEQQKNWEQAMEENRRLKAALSAAQRLGIDPMRGR